MDVPDSLRLLVISGAMSESLGRLIDLQADEEKMEMKLLAVAGGPALFDAAVAEAEMRAERISRRWAEQLQSPPVMTPRAAGIRSVFEDVITGRFY